MSMTLEHNLAAMNSMRLFNITGKKQSKSTEQLSSGYKINRAADDAAGLSISEKMRRQIRGLTQASANAQDGISLVQSAEGALGEVHDMLQRGNELAVKAANGTLTDDDRALVDMEIQQLKEAIDKTVSTTTFNEINLFPPKGISPKTIPDSSSNITFRHYDITMNPADGNVSVTSTDSANAGAAAYASARSGSVLADKIANEFFPQAMSQILDAFPSIKNAIGSTPLNVGLDISYIDGTGNVLAQASFGYYPDGSTTGFKIQVDSTDFTDADAEGTGAASEALRSTIAHELMHSVMQYTMTKGMVGLNGTEQFPTWFKEGTAQLSGGGYTTGWNYTLTLLTNSLTSENDTAQDSAIANYLKSYTVEGRPYGHGYLECAYIGYIANGSGIVDSASIAAGMDKVFTNILNGMNFSDAVYQATGRTVSSLVSAINNGSASATEFVRRLSYNANGGAGSVITPALNTGGTAILTGGTSTPPIAPGDVTVDATGNGSQWIGLQVGCDSGQHIEIPLFQMNCQALDLADVNTKTQGTSGEAITAFKNAIGYVSNVRSYLGAVQNRLEHTINNLNNIVENTTASESLIRDTDIANEMVKYTNYNILLQAGQAMLTQANHQPEVALSLLQ